MRRLRVEYRDYLILCGWYGLIAITPKVASPTLFLLLVLASVAIKVEDIFKLFTLQFLLINVNSGLFGNVWSGGAHCLLPVVALARLALTGYFTSFFQQYGRFQFVAFCLGGLFAHSFLFSLYPEVSTAKLILYSSHLMACLVAINIASCYSRKHVLMWFTHVTIFCIWASLPVLLTPFAKMINGTGFNGIFVHPQVLGHVLGIGIAYLIVQAYFQKKVQFYTAITIGVGLTEVYLSECRGGLFTCMCAVAIALLWEITFTSGIHSMKFLSRLFVCATTGIGLLGIFSEDLLARYQYFIEKSGRASAGSFQESFNRSRGTMIQEHLIAWSQNPLGGIGFQVSSSATFERTIVYDAVTGRIPISAAVEDGFVYSAILKQGGILGGVFMYGIMGAFLLPVFRCTPYPERVLIAAVFLSNLTEATFFASSGMGAWMTQLLVVATSVSRGTRNEFVGSKSESRPHNFRAQLVQGVSRQ